MELKDSPFAVVWSDATTPRLWDSETGESLATLGGHTESVREAIELAGGRLLSWSGDKSLPGRRKGRLSS